MKQVVWLSGVFILISSATNSCVPLAPDDCKALRSCPEDASGGASTDGGADGDGDGDGDGSGGEPAGSGGHDATGGEDASGGMGGDPNACSEANCEGYCVNDQCFDCVKGDDDKACKDASTPACLNDGTCVECDEDEQCADPEASMCDTQKHECVACEGDEQCAHLEETSLCSPTTNTCVQCTVADESACGANSCDPATNTCTTTPRASLNACEGCQADSECKTNFRCVPMEFQGQAREGGYCLKDSTVEGCTVNPYRAPSPARVSLSGEEATVYCSINETLTTCEAVLDLNKDKDCTTADDCGVPGLNDGLCETVSLSPNKCTYGCQNVADCNPSGTGSSCAGDAAGSAATYCGG